MSDNFDKEIKEIFLDEIIPNRFQPRLNFDQKSLIELSDSIKQHGIIQPLVLRKLGEKYEIIAGERRYKASQIAGLVKVPAIIVDFDDNKSAEVAIVENLHRKQMSSLEEARAFKKLLQKGLKQEQLGMRLGKSQSYIANKLRLLSLSERVQDALIKEQISERHARSLLTIKDEEEQIKMLEEIIINKLTVKETDEKIKLKFGEENIFEDISKTNVDDQQLLEEINEEKNIEIFQPDSLDADIMNDELSKDITEDIVKENIMDIKSKEDIMNFSLENTNKEVEQLINAPKPFVLMDQGKNVPSFELPSFRAEPHNNVENNPQKEMIEKLSNVNPNLEDTLFKDTSLIKQSPYVIPKIDIEDKYLKPGSSLDVFGQSKKEPSSNLENTNSFNIDQILNKGELEIDSQNSFNNKEVKDSFNIEQLLQSDVTNNESPQSVYQNDLVNEKNEQPQNRFIVDIPEQKPESNQDIANAKNLIKKIVMSLKESGVSIDFEEFDFERLYQIIIKIEK